jgi:hypothetical protein
MSIYTDRLWLNNVEYLPGEYDYVNSGTTMKRIQIYMLEVIIGQN